MVANVGTATLHGYAYGGQGGDIGGSGGAGGVGFDIQANGSGFNWGRIFGGQGGGPIGGQGGAGVTLEGVYFHNRFIVRGGAGDSGTAGDSGGEGVDASAGKAVNDGAIYGGAGSDSVSYDPHNRGGGGTGVSLTGTASLLNYSNIYGGDAGEIGSDAGASHTGFAGGVGVSLAGGVSAVNYGQIKGGVGGGAYGTNNTFGGQGGAAVYIDGGSFDNYGTVTGGQGGGGNSGKGAQGDAVKFGANAGTLIVEAGSTFNGKVEANSAVADTLTLSGNGGYATFGGIGTQFTGFTTFNDRGDTVWTIDSTAADLATIQTISLTSVDKVVLDGGGALTHDYSGLDTLDLHSGSFTANDTISSQLLHNEASIYGAAGQYHGPGAGLGVFFLGGELLNDGKIVGGSAGVERLELRPIVEPQPLDIVDKGFRKARRWRNCRIRAPSRGGRRRSVFLRRWTDVPSASAPLRSRQPSTRRLKIRHRARSRLRLAPPMIVIPV